MCRDGVKGRGFMCLGGMEGRGSTCRGGVEARVFMCRGGVEGRAVVRRGEVLLLRREGQKKSQQRGMLNTEGVHQDTSVLHGIRMPLPVVRP